MPKDAEARKRKKDDKEQDDTQTKKKVNSWLILTQVQKLVVHKINARGKPIINTRINYIFSVVAEQQKYDIRIGIDAGNSKTKVKIRLIFFDYLDGYVQKRKY